MNRIKCYIYGAGNEYNRLSSCLSRYNKKIEILGIVTTEKQKFSTLDKIPCFLLREIDIKKMDYIIIAVKAWKEVAEYIRNFGIDEENILRSNIFSCSYFDLNEYLKLKKSNVSILSNFCLGGRIYKELGLKALSPTINMFCLGDDYKEFIEHFQYYLAKDMKMYLKTDTNYIKGTLNRETFIPKGIIDNKVIWYFNHSERAEDAIIKWNESKKRVNFDNIVVLMTIQSDEEAYWFNQLPIKKKLGVYYKDLHLQSIIYCSDWNDEKLRLKYLFNWPSYANSYMTNSIMASKVNWIKFLNGGNGYLRY